MTQLAVSSEEKNLQQLVSPASGCDFEDCPVVTAIDVIGGKWKVILLYQLRGRTLRFGELKKMIPRITQKMLTQQLRELEKDKLISRKVYAEVPPRVEYTSTELAEKLSPVLDSLSDWGTVYRQAHA